MTSKIKVDNIENQCGGAVVTKCGGTTTISGSIVKSNAIQASDGGNLVSQSGTTITLGASGDTINLASGASQSGFGRTGTVDWQTTPKTATFTAVSGEGYFCNTSGGEFTVNLPAGSAGAIVSIQDYNNTFDSNNLTIDANGSEKINGGEAGIALVLSTEGQGLTLIYVDGTVGWRSVHSDDFSQVPENPAFIAATGGTITTVCTNFKVHTFTGPGTFCVSNVGNASGSNKISYMVVAGGGGGGHEDAGGGGAGGFRESKSPATPYTTSPIAATGGITVSPGANPITVGAGGAGGNPPTATPAAQGTNGSNSIFSGPPAPIVSTGGGGAGGGECNSDGGIRQGKPGGSGGGGAGVFGPQPQDGPSGPAGGSGNTPSVSPSQGFPGGNGPTLPRLSNNVAELGAGGGGATQVGQKTPSPTTCGAGGAGGAGATTSINNTPTAYAGGGGGGIHTYGGGAGSRSAGGTPTAGQGGTPGPNANKAGTDASANSGGGGGGSGGNGGPPAAGGGDGGSGIVIIRYKFQ